MKTTLAAAILILALTSGARAADATARVDRGTVSAKTDTRPIEGIVRKVDPAAAKITLTHGPLPNGMPGMTMAFNVKAPARLDGLQAGQKVLFAIDDAMAVVHLEPAK